MAATSLRALTLMAVAIALAAFIALRLLSGKGGWLGWLVLLGGLILAANLVIIATAPAQGQQRGTGGGLRWVDQGRLRAVPGPVETTEELPDPLDDEWDLPLL